MYTVAVFKDIGNAFCVSVLDYYKCNPVSRIPTSWYRNLEGVKNDLIQKCNIFIPKRKEDPVRPIHGIKTKLAQPSTVEHRKKSLFDA